MDAETAANIHILADTTSHYPFSSLQTLEIHIPLVSACTRLIELMHTCRLRSLRLIHSIAATAVEVRDLFAALEVHNVHHSLEIVELELSRKSSRGAPDEDFTITHLRPILSFPFITSFLLSVPLSYAFDNAAVAEIADAWPHLCDLSLGWNWGGGARPTVTWAAVAYALSKCPFLEHLTLQLDASIDDTRLLVKQPTFRPHHRLRFFGAFDCILPPDAETLAETLWTLAPRVLTIVGWDLANRPQDPQPSESVVDVEAFFSQAETIMWQLRRKHMPQFAYLDQYREFFLSDFAVFEG